MLLAAPTLILATTNCLYCRRSDSTATLLVSYSYCAGSDTCLQDKWLYISRPCSTGWKRGKDLNVIKSCAPKKTTCHPFVSDPKARGNWFNYTETLGANEYCEISVDAKNYVAHVVLDDAVTVGATYRKDGKDEKLKVG